MSGKTVSDRLANLRDRPRFSALKVPVALIVFVLVLRPVLEQKFLLGSSQIATTMLIWMLFATAYNLLFGYGGLLSFGHAMFLGAGLYAVAIGLTQFDIPYLLAAPIGVVVAGAVAYGIARLISGYGEIYFALLTLAFAEAAHFIVNANPFDLTGGSDGIRSVSPAWIESFRGQQTVVVGGFEFDFYFLVGAVFVVSVVAIWQILRSPFGRTLVAIRDNEELAAAMGISTFRYKVWAFTLSAAFTAVAGALLAVNNNGAALEDMGALTSGNVVLMSIFGGVAYFFGPITGVFSWFFAREFLTTLETIRLPLGYVVEVGGILSFWRFFFGFLFVVVILIAPREGIWGFVRGRVDAAIATIRSVTGDE